MSSFPFPPLGTRLMLTKHHQSFVFSSCQDFLLPGLFSSFYFLRNSHAQCAVFKFFNWKSSFSLANIAAASGTLGGSYLKMTIVLNDTINDDQALSVSCFFFLSRFSSSWALFIILFLRNSSVQFSSFLSHNFNIKQKQQCAIFKFF